MRPIVPPDATNVLKAPPSMGEDCADLAVHVSQGPHSPELRSLWKPSHEELQVLNEGGFVMLTVASNVHPPVELGVSPLLPMKVTLH